jgi:hypothetical protein
VLFQRKVEYLNIKTTVVIFNFDFLGTGRIRGGSNLHPKEYV